MLEAVLGSEIKLKCEIDANPLPILTWSRVVDDKVSREILRQRPEDSKYGYLERIITEEDEGTWRCGASSNFAGGHVDFSITVIGMIQCRSVCWCVCLLPR